MFEEKNFIYNTQGTGCEPAAKLSVYMHHLSRRQLEFALFFYSADVPRGNQVNFS